MARSRVWTGNKTELVFFLGGRRRGGRRVIQKMTRPMEKGGVWGIPTKLKFKVGE